LLKSSFGNQNKETLENFQSEKPNVTTDIFCIKSVEKDLVETSLGNQNHKTKDNFEGKKLSNSPTDIFSIESVKKDLHETSIGNQKNETKDNFEGKKLNVTTDIFCPRCFIETNSMKEMIQHLDKEHPII
jgi:hypothetical protein